MTYRERLLARVHALTLPPTNGQPFDTDNHASLREHLDTFIAATPTKLGPVTVDMVSRKQRPSAQELFCQCYQGVTEESKADFYWDTTTVCVASMVWLLVRL